MRLAELTRNGISPRPDGSKPLEGAIPLAKADPQVATLLQPLPYAVGAQGSKRKWSTDDAASKAENASKGKGRGKKGKAKGRGKGAVMPAALKGMHSKTPQGRPICFNFNMSGCSSANCSMAHVCCKPGCYKTHPVSQHAEAACCQKQVLHPAALALGDAELIRHLNLASSACTYEKDVFFIQPSCCAHGGPLCRSTSS